MAPNRQTDSRPGGRRSTTGIIVGIAVGVAIGVAMDNIGAGIGIGLAIGIASAWAFGDRGNKPK